MIEWRQRAEALAEQLYSTGSITDPGWQTAFAATPRHVFVPQFWALNEYNAPDHLVDSENSDQREVWLNAVYSDQFLATQWTQDGDQRIITSSASLPTLVAQMLHLLDLREGHRVLEIGTGSGYNTALLCHQAGDTGVASIDIDPHLVSEAQSRLERIGLKPLLVAGDGAAGVDKSAPYDRILSTCASPGVPPAWISQLADGGKIVAPFTFGGALAVVTKTGPDEVSGRFVTEQAWFMPMRPSDAPMPAGHLIDLPEETDGPAAHHGSLDIDSAALSDPDFHLWLCLHLPTARLANTFDDDWTKQTGVVVYTSTHRATITFPGKDSGKYSTVLQDDRRLADTVEAAWRAWQRHGRPSRDRLGITASTSGVQRAWLNTADSGLSWPLPA